MDYIHQTPLSMRILQARILEWVALPSSRGSSQPRDQTQISCIAGGHLLKGGLLDSTLAASFSDVTEVLACPCARAGLWYSTTSTITEENGAGPVYRLLLTRLAEVSSIRYGPM